MESVRLQLGSSPLGYSLETLSRLEARIIIGLTSLVSPFVRDCCPSLPDAQSSEKFSLLLYRRVNPAPIIPSWPKLQVPSLTPFLITIQTEENNLSVG